MGKPDIIMDKSFRFRSKNLDQSSSEPGRKPLRVGLFGDGKWAQNVFILFQRDPLIELKFITLRYKQPDVQLKELSKAHGIPCHIHPNINSEEFIRQAKSYDCELFVSLSFDQIFRVQIINIPVCKTINCHAGKLPFYRGRNVLNWALINDESEFGITVHYVDEGIDTGDIILQRTYPITDADNYSTLLERAQTECANVTLEAVHFIAHDQVDPVPQEQIHPVGTYCSGRGVGDEILNWDMSSREIFNFVRAICEPGPMARCWVNDHEFCINSVEMVPNAPIYRCIPGAVLMASKDGVYIKTRDSMVRVTDFRSNGRRLRVGDRLQPSPGIE